MKYLLLIYGDETQAANATPEEAAALMDPWWAYEGWLAEKGIKLAGEALFPTAQATTVRSEGGRTVTIDGPFAETKEQLGGFYLIETSNLDEALEAAERCPGSSTGSIEVRPVQEFEVPQ